VELRPDARGILEADFASRQVWTLRAEGQVVAETLLLRRDGDHITYTLTNAPLGTPLAVMARRKSQRYFVERAIQDAKSELGWDEFQAVKYRAWQHHLALTILASWFIAETRLDWALDHPQDPALAQQYETDVLPALSVANVREMLRAALPLPQLSPEQAALLVVKHLDNRTRSRKSRLRRRFRP
jgi:SRSO17 transposase